MHINCPHCQNPIEMVDESPVEVVCPSCGSSIMLDPGRTRTFLPTGAARKIGKFTLLEHLGAGAFGNVYKARDTELDRLVAVKVPRVGNLTTHEDVDRFLREARSAAQLNHPGIVSLYDAGQSDGTYYLVSEFIQGTTLSERLGAGRLPLRQAAQLIADVADALHYAHEHGVVHRDVKPSNIMLDKVSGAASGLDTKVSSPFIRYFSPKLMDFGLAKRDAGEITMTLEGQVLGTPAYMSPEQACGEGHRVDARSDVYSLGVILYELLTGELPFRGNSRMLITQVLQDEPRPPRRIDDRIPRDLETICLKAMAKIPAQRFVSTSDMANELRRWLRGEPIQTRPVGSMERLLRWCRRKPAIAALAAALLCVFATGFAGVVWQWRMATTAAAAERAASTRLNTQHQELVDAKNTAERKEQEATEASNRERQARIETEIQRQKTLYAAHMPLAQRALGSGRDDVVLKLLEAQLPSAGMPDHRTFEWYFLWRICHREYVSFVGHAADLKSVAFSSDGTTLATASEDGTARIWDVSTGQQLSVLQGHTAEVTSVSFAPRERVIATGSADKTVRLWDVSSGRVVAVLRGAEQPIHAVCFAPDGTLLAAAGGGDSTGEVIVWDSKDRTIKTKLSGHQAPVKHAVFSRNGALLATAEGGDLSGSRPQEIRIWDATTFQEVRTLPGVSGSVAGIDFFPDNQTLVTGTLDPSGQSVVRLWDVQTGDSQSPVRLDGSLNLLLALAVSPDGNSLVTTDGLTASIWDVTSGKRQATFRGHSGLIASVRFSPDGRWLATGAKSGDTTAKLWEIDADPNPRTLTGHRGWVSSVAFTPDGKLLASVSRTLPVRDVEAAEIILSDPATGRTIRATSAATRDIYSVAVSPDGKMLATAGDDKAVKLWDTSGGEIVDTLRAHNLPVTYVAFSPDGRSLASADGEHYSITPDGRAMDTWSSPGHVVVWDIAERSVRKTLGPFDAPVGALSYSADGTMLATGTKDGKLSIWESQSGRLITEFRSFNKSISALAFAPDGQSAAVAGFEPGPSEIGYMKVYCVPGWTLRATLIGHANVVNTIAYSPDSRTVASGSWDGTVRLWDPELGLERFSVRGAQVNAVAFSPDGTLLVTGNTDKTVRVWSAAREKEVPQEIAIQP